MGLESKYTAPIDTIESFMPWLEQRSDNPHVANLLPPSIIRAYGAVMGLQDIPRAISVARQVLEKSEHSILVGRGATKFGVSQGFLVENILTEVGR